LEARGTAGRETCATYSGYPRGAAQDWDRTVSHAVTEDRVGAVALGRYSLARKSFVMEGQVFRPGVLQAFWSVPGAGLEARRNGRSGDLRYLGGSVDLNLL